MSDKPTPRTDAVLATQPNNGFGLDKGQCICQWYDFARQLERELADMTTRLDACETGWAEDTAEAARPSTPPRMICPVGGEKHMHISPHHHGDRMTCGQCQRVLVEATEPLSHVAASTEAVTVDGPLGGFSVVGQAANELDLMLTQFQLELEAGADQDSPIEEQQFHSAMALDLKRGIIDRYTPPSARADIMEECAVLAGKKSDNPKEYTDQPEDYEYWRGYAKGREDAATEIRVNAASDKSAKP